MMFSVHGFVGCTHKHLWPCLSCLRCQCCPAEQKSACQVLPPSHLMLLFVRAICSYLLVMILGISKLEMLLRFEILGALRQLSSLNFFYFFKGKGFLSPEHEPHLAFVGHYGCSNWAGFTFRAHFLICQRAADVLFPPIRSSTCCVSNICIPCQSKRKMTEA